MTRTAIAALLASTTLAHAQEDGSLSAYLELIKPDRIVTQLIQIGVLGLRTQADVTYEDLSVNIAGGEISMTGLALWPLPDWDENVECVIRADRIGIASAPITDVNRYLARVTVIGGSVTGACLPPDQQPVLAAAGLEDIAVPSMTVDIDYDIPSSALALRSHAEVEGLAAVDLSADFAYAWFDTRLDPDNPEPVLFLSGARLSLENGGGWDALKALLPPGATDPETAALVAEGAVGAALADANRQSAGVQEDGGADPSALSPAQRAFVEQAAATWATFVANPERLMLETVIEEDLYLDILGYGDDPRLIFDDLRPVVGIAPLSAERMVAPETLRMAMEEPESLTEAQRRAVGLALLTGDGAPRAVALGAAFVAPLADAGDLEVAALLAEVLAETDPAEAYRHALLANEAGALGSGSVLDRLEGMLEPAEILAAQTEAAGDAAGAEAPGTAAEARRLALAHLTGRGALRSYELASLHARIGAALGDAASAGLLEQLDARMADPAFAEAEERAATAALDAWMTR